ncbi:hypothetical protein GGR23_001653 [Gellertiella hungarica]|uniref:Uncharacterized protein n=1 Tax=Gellertiella hungarica TaxID=1572859 RepID=A0A7W6J5V3_9HYPH|nr:hypothetical protein [Gellertiella hungarica]
MPRTASRLPCRTPLCPYRDISPSRGEIECASHGVAFAAPPPPSVPAGTSPPQGGRSSVPRTASRLPCRTPLCPCRGISPSRGEIDFAVFDFPRQQTSHPQKRLLGTAIINPIPISPLEGEMPGRAEGGAVPQTRRFAGQRGVRRLKLGDMQARGRSHRQTQSPPLTPPPAPLPSAAARSGPSASSCADTSPTLNRPHGSTTESLPSGRKLIAFPLFLMPNP